MVELEVLEEVVRRGRVGKMMNMTEVFVNLNYSVFPHTLSQRMNL